MLRRSSSTCTASRARGGFDPLAAQLAYAGYRVICPDLVGRGQSDWLENTLDYVFPQYCADMGSLLAMIGKKVVHWLGTSLGGLIGIVLAGVPRSPIATLIVNDIGPGVAFQASSCVAMRLVFDLWSFDSFEDVVVHMRKIYKGCGPLTDEHGCMWPAIPSGSTTRLGGLSHSPIPRSRRPSSGSGTIAMSLLNYWDELALPVLAVWDRSDFVTADLLAKMKRSKPMLNTFEVAETDADEPLRGGRRSVLPEAVRQNRRCRRKPCPSYRMT